MMICILFVTNTSRLILLPVLLQTLRFLLLRRSLHRQNRHQIVLRSLRHTTLTLPRLTHMSWNDAARYETGVPSSFSIMSAFSTARFTNLKYLSFTPLRFPTSAESRT